MLEAAKTVDNPFDAYAENPFVMPEGREITQNDIEGAGYSKGEVATGLYIPISVAKKINNGLSGYKDLSSNVSLS